MAITTPSRVNTTWVDRGQKQGNERMRGQASRFSRVPAAYVLVVGRYP